jgi:hypothetical protein
VTVEINHTVSSSCGGGGLLRDSAIYYSIRGRSDA